MFAAIASTALIILVGVAWRAAIGAKKAEALRRELAQSVYAVFLPALVLSVLWPARIDLDTLRVPLIAASCVLGSLLAAWLFYGNGRIVRAFGVRRQMPAIGALLLASGFGNFTYLGLPTLTQAFGEEAAKTAIQFDLLASTPLLFTVGLLIAMQYGKGTASGRIGGELLRTPPFLAACLGLALAAIQLPPPAWLLHTLRLLGGAVVPLMLVAVGLALSWRRAWAARLPLLAPVLLVQLGLMPLIAWATSAMFGITGELRAQVIVEAAMPTMVLGLVLCDRYRLDGELYAEAITITTAASLLTVPLWLAFASS